MTLKALMRMTSRLLLVSVGVGGLLISTPSPAQSQVNREAIRSLNLSRSQMRQMRGVMQGYQSELGEILTPEQQRQLEDLQAERQNQPTPASPPDLAAELNLSVEQASQLETLRTSMGEDLRAILSEEQIGQAQELGLPGL
jgi:hypothetical protein